MGVFQRAELAALRAKREEEEEIRRSRAKQDRLFVFPQSFICTPMFLLEVFANPILM